MNPNNQIGRKFEAWIGQLLEDNRYKVIERNLRIKEEKKGIIFRKQGIIVNNSEIDLVVRTARSPRHPRSVRYAIECKYHDLRSGKRVSAEDVSYFCTKLMLEGSPARRGYITTNTEFVEHAQAIVSKFQKSSRPKIRVQLYSREDLERLDYQRLGFRDKKSYRRGDYPSLEEQIRRTRI